MADWGAVAFLLAVLGRFVYTLNQFCREQYGMSYCVTDYWIYEFAKVRPSSGIVLGQHVAMTPVSCSETGCGLDKQGSCLP